MMTRQLKLGAFMRPLSIHTGAWRYPGAYPDSNFNFKHLQSFARKLEAAKFDAFFMADHLAVLNMPVEAQRSAWLDRLTGASRKQRWQAERLALCPSLPTKDLLAIEDEAALCGDERQNDGIASSTSVTVRPFIA